MTRLAVKSVGFGDSVAQHCPLSGEKTFQASDTLAQGNQANMEKAMHQRVTKTMPKTEARYVQVPFSKIRRYWKSNESLMKASASVRQPMYT